MLDHDLEHLRSELQKAIELEFSTIPPYLTAMYSIVPGTNQPAADIIRSVVMEEMLHLTLAANLLSAIGGRPALNVAELLPEYPIQLKFSDRQFPIGLQKFSPEAIETFLRIEMPARLLPSGRLQRPGENLLRGGFRDVDLTGRTIGEFYADIIQALEDACRYYGEEQVFTGDPARQVDTRYYYNGGGEALRIGSLKEALEALHLIVDQGEAAGDSLSDGDTEFGQAYEVAHYYRFNEIKHQRYYAPTDKFGDEPSGPEMRVDYAAVYDMRPNPRQQDYPAGSALAQAADEFNQLYTGFMNVLHEAFNGRPDALIEAVTLMFSLKYKAIELLKNPIPDADGQHAGPGFEFLGGPAVPQLLAADSPALAAAPAATREAVYASV
jgi:Ferritin-like